MATTTQYHSLCRWTFNAGKGGFLPANVRPSWSASELDSAGVVRLIKKEIAPRLPEHIKLGYEVHYDTEVNEGNAQAIADALGETGMHLAMITPGGHSHFAFGGIASPDPSERAAARALGERTVDLAYGTLRGAWHPEVAPSLVLWNGSWGYDLASLAIKEMYQHLKESLAGLCRHEAAAGGELHFAIEPKPNEGHPAMLLATVASAILIWRKLEDEFGISRAKKGVNKEFGHSEMIGLDHVYDSIEELDHDAMQHVHLNSQGYNDGILMGGPGKFDIDFGTRINGMNIIIAAVLQDAGYSRWLGHDMQPRPYDNEQQAVDRVVRSILSWEACHQAAMKLDRGEMSRLMQQRETASVEDMIRGLVADAQKTFDTLLKKS